MCVVRAMASSVDLPLEALHYDRGHCYRVIVIHADGLGVLGHRDDGVPLEAGGKYRQAEGEVEDVTEDPC